MKKSLFLLLSIFIVLSKSIQANEHVIWDKLPIQFIVPVGEERIISFPDSVNVKSIGTGLTTDKVEILNNKGTLYIKSKKEFAPVRIAVTLQKSNDVILVDILSKDNVPNTSVEVMLKEDLSKKDTSKNILPNSDYISLIRSAIHELYAPERLLEEHSNFKRTPMHTTSNIHLFWNKQVIAKPLASWSSGNHYVTAVILKNMSEKNLELNYEGIRGTWIAASLYPTDNLTKKGTKNDRTTLFLVSNKPFHYAYLSNRGGV